MLRALWISLRPLQWLKNIFVLAPLLFAQAYGEPELVQLALAAVVIFSLAASATYLVNDVLDRTADRKHPRKKLRPIASGELPVPVALGAAVVLIAVALGSSWQISPVLTEVMGSYLVLNGLYSVWLKRVVLVDLLTIALGFVLRVVAGAVAIGVVASPWLLAVTLLLTFLLAAGKRRQELVGVEAESHAHTREVLLRYDVKFLDGVLGMGAGGTLLLYVLYTLEIAPKLLLTVPLVAYGLLRYVLLLRSGVQTDGPTELFARDWPLRVVVLLWVAAVVVLLEL